MLAPQIYADLLRGYIDLQIKVHIWSVLVDAVKSFCCTSQHEVSKLLKFCYASIFSIKGRHAGTLNLCEQKCICVYCYITVHCIKSLDGVNFPLTPYTITPYTITPYTLYHYTIHVTPLHHTPYTLHHAPFPILSTRSEITHNAIKFQILRLLLLFRFTIRKIKIK